MILSSELIRARRTKEKLIPLFATSEKRSLAKTLVEIYKEHIDMKRWELQEALDSCEELGYDFKLVRGISEILNSHCIYGVRSFVPPLKARALLFQEAVKENVLSKARRDIILTRVADILQIKTNELEDSMYADLLDEQRLTDFSEITPDDLMKTYNFALICAILTYANKIDFTINSKVIGLTEVANALGEADFKGTTQIKAGIKLKPMKHVSLRGSKIETLLSLIMDSKEWALRADVAYPPRYRDTKPVELDSKGLGTQLKAKKVEEELIIEVKAPIRQSSFGDIIVLDDVARKLDLTDRELMRRIEAEKVKFIKLPGVLVTQEKLDLLRADLDSIEDDEFRTFKDILKGHGVKNPVAVLEALGYLIEPNSETRRLRVYRLRRRASP